jgi:hypothetical protein
MINSGSYKAGEGDLGIQICYANQVIF